MEGEDVFLGLKFSISEVKKEFVEVFWLDEEVVSKMSRRDVMIYHFLLTRVKEVHKLGKGYSSPIPLRDMALLVSKRKVWLFESEVVFCNSVTCFGYAYKKDKLVK